MINNIYVDTVTKVICNTPIHISKKDTYEKPVNYDYINTVTKVISEQKLL